MTIIIAHRGLIDGPNKDLENHPESFLKCREIGFDVEVDVWYSDGTWYTGHDEPQYPVSYEFLQDIDRAGYLGQHHAWLHAKNIPALYELRRRWWQGHLFWHQEDDVVVTTTGFLWTYPGKKLTPLSICVMPEWQNQLENIRLLNVAGICTDFANQAKTQLESLSINIA
jgi:glycerophosphoryl diester phosphodiesterase